MRIRLSAEPEGAGDVGCGGILRDHGGGAEGSDGRRDNNGGEGRRRPTAAADVAATTATITTAAERGCNICCLRNRAAVLDAVGIDTAAVSEATAASHDRSITRPPPVRAAASAFPEAIHAVPEATRAVTKAAPHEAARAVTKAAPSEAARTFTKAPREAARTVTDAAHTHGCHNR